MRAQEKNIKGFNILELLIVVVIIGIISGAAYPSFSEWRQERKAKGSTVKIKSIIEGINAQVQKGQYAYVQVVIDVREEDGEWKMYLTSKGMKMHTLASKINDGDSVWNTDPQSRCNILDPNYWDDDPEREEDEDKISVRQIEVPGIAANFKGMGAVCFGKDARWFSGAGTLVGGTDADAVADERIFVCVMDEDNDSTCDMNESTGEPTTGSNEKNVYSVDWTRFGEVTMYKWSPNKADWVLH